MYTNHIYFNIYDKDIIYIQYINILLNIIVSWLINDEQFVSRI
jgi:hypothetical protein